jgi:aspartate aminotransferase
MAKHGHKHIYVPNPTWGNHIPIFTNSGLEVRKYRYYDAESSDLDFDNMMKDIKDMPKGSLILLHACTSLNLPNLRTFQNMVLFLFE